MLGTEKVITETRIKCVYLFTCGSLRFRAMPPVSWQSQWICQVCYHVKTHTGHGVRCAAGRVLALRDAMKQYPSISSKLDNKGLRVGAACHRAAKIKATRQHEETVVAQAGTMKHSGPSGILPSSSPCLSPPPPSPSSSSYFFFFFNPQVF